MFKSVLLTNLDWSRLLHIGHICRRVLMERDKVDIYNNAKRTRPISAADPGKGPGRPAPLPPHPAPLMFRAKWGPNGRKICFWTPAPPPPQIWTCHCISCHLDRTSLVNKRFITWPKRKGCRRTSGRERQVQSEHRICLTLPAGRVSHIQLIWSFDHLSDHFMCPTSNLLNF